MSQMKVRVLLADRKEGFLESAVIEEVCKDDEKPCHKLVLVGSTGISIKNSIIESVGLKRGVSVTLIEIHDCMPFVIALIKDLNLVRWPNLVYKLPMEQYLYFNPRKQCLPICSHGHLPGELKALGIRDKCHES